MSITLIQNWLDILVFIRYPLNHFILIYKIKSILRTKWLYKTTNNKHTLLYFKKKKKYLARNFSNFVFCKIF